ncbi:SMI1/KNR4 family protein [Anatilimnocola sp. NA78]|uniref:SMI1/KNR4 family protein n=1 Tax=Anatilimnocola sp. NA78 TaxID=3415683 RepID=UPI003CE4A224
MTTFKQLWPATTPEAIAAFEQKAGLRLPALYRRFLLTTNGGVPGRFGFGNV